MVCKYQHIHLCQRNLTGWVLYRLIVINDLYLSIKSYIYPTAIFFILSASKTFSICWENTFLFCSHPNWWRRSKQLVNANPESTADLLIPPTVRLFDWRNPFCQAPYMMTSSNENIFPRYWPFVRGIHRWRGDLIFSLICTWTNKRLSKQSRRRWLETPSLPLWRHCNDKLQTITYTGTGLI